MRHNLKKTKFGIRAAYGTALVRNLVTSLLEHGKIETTEKRAKALKAAVDRLISKAVRQGGVQGARSVDTMVMTKKAYERFNTLKDTFRMDGSNVRITKLRNRTGDNATIVQVDLIAK
jgi:large subunit ribosomal protein L17